METGALGITTALIYPPAFFARTDELIELCNVVAKYKGKYTTHMRSEGNQLIEGVQETIRISREAGLPVEIYHLKASGEAYASPRSCHSREDCRRDSHADQ